MITTRKSHERRCWKRYRCDLGISCQTVESGSAEPSAGRIEDISCGGVKFASSQRFTPGAVLKLYVNGADDKAPRVLVAQVMHVSDRPSGGSVMGCQFFKLISEKDLARLLSLFQDETSQPAAVWPEYRYTGPRLAWSG